MTAKKAIIIGSGIAGPATALALQKIGWQATIYEAYSTSAHGIGANLGLALNGLDALRTLQIHETVKALGVPTPHLIMWNGNGKRLGEVYSGEALSDGTVNITMQRADLFAVLSETALARGIQIVYGKRLVDVKESGQEIVATFADGSEAVGSVLIGADGMYSRTRQLIDPDAPKPHYVGLIGSGGKVSSLDLDPTPDTLNLTFGKRAFFGHTILADGTVWWFANKPLRPEPSQASLSTLALDEWKQELAHLFADDAVPAKRIIEATQHLSTPMAMHYMEAPKRWYRGRMVLIGDAAHVASPSSGQGASLAIEDALEIVRCLRDGADHVQAFSTFQQLREMRVKRVLEGGKRVNNDKAAGPMGRIIRDALFPILLKWLTKPGANAWLHNHHIEFDQSILSPSAPVV